MKRKMILPLLAIVFALSSAFAPALIPQQAWYRTGVGNNVDDDSITTPNDTEENPCDFSGDHACLIGAAEAYSTSAAAAGQLSAYILKFD